MDMDVYFTPQKKPLYEQIVEMIESKIINGDIKVGDKLPTESELGAMYKVSRTVIREAMKTLKEKGWVDTQVAKGTYVIENTGKSIQNSFQMAVQTTPEYGFNHLIEIRLMLEPEIAALAAVRACDDEIARMYEAVLLMNDSLEDHEKDDPELMEKFLKGDNAFHNIMAESTDNPLVPIIIAPVVNLMRKTQKFHLFTVKGGKNKSQQYHLLIMDAIKNHNPDLARKYMYEHIMQVKTDVESQNPDKK